MDLINRGGDGQWYIDVKMQLYPQIYGARQGTQKTRESTMDASNADSEAWHGKVRSGEVQYGTARGAVRCGAVRHGTVRPGSARPGPAQYGTVRHRMARYDTVWFGPAQYLSEKHEVFVVPEVIHSEDAGDLLVPCDGQDLQ